MRTGNSLHRLAVLFGSALLVLAGATATEAQSLPGQGKTARAVRASWDTFWFGSVILQIGLEKLGYKVEPPKTLSGVAVYQALDQGEADFTADTVVPFSSPFVEKFKDTVSNVGPIMNPGSIQGYLIDRATSEKYNVRYVSDLLDPEKAKIFSDGESKARMIGPNAGWGSEKVVLADFKKLGLDKTVKLVQGEYNVLIGDSVARYRTGHPVLLYAWYPNPATVEMKPGTDLVWLAMKTGEASPEEATPGVVGCAVNADPCNTGQAPSQYFISVNKSWALANPSALKFFSLIKMRLSDRVAENIKMMKGENREENIRAHAVDWITQNQHDFDGWIKEASQAK